MRNEGGNIAQIVVINLKLPCELYHIRSGHVYKNKRRFVTVLRLPCVPLHVSAIMLHKPEPSYGKVFRFYRIT